MWAGGLEDFLPIFRLGGEELGEKQDNVARVGLASQRQRRRLWSKKWRGLRSVE
jgi:hypothetical protein